ARVSDGGRAAHGDADARRRPRARPRARRSRPRGVRRRLVGGAAPRDVLRRDRGRGDGAHARGGDVGAGAVILTYHGVGEGGSPLEVSRTAFAAHLDAIAASRAPVLTVAELARSLRMGGFERGVVITFDDGFRSVVRTAAPLLAERGFTA